jgi:hypothetical protein
MIEENENRAFVKEQKSQQKKSYLDILSHLRLEPASRAKSVARFVAREGLPFVAGVGAGMVVDEVMKSDDPDLQFNIFAWYFSTLTTSGAALLSYWLIDFGLEKLNWLREKSDKDKEFDQAALDVPFYQTKTSSRQKACNFFKSVTPYALGILPGIVIDTAFYAGQTDRRIIGGKIWISTIVNSFTTLLVRYLSARAFQSSCCKPSQSAQNSSGNEGNLLIERPTPNYGRE